MDIMDGQDSGFFHYFKSLFLRGLMELKKHVDTFVKIVEIMSKGSKMPCFQEDSSSIINNFKERFHINKSELELVKIVNEGLKLGLYLPDLYDVIWGLWENFWTVIIIFLFILLSRYLDCLFESLRCRHHLLCRQLSLLGSFFWLPSSAISNVTNVDV